MFHLAARCGRPSIVEDLLRLLEDLNDEEHMNVHILGISNNGGRTALEEALLTDHAEIANMLLSFHPHVKSVINGGKFFIFYHILLISFFKHEMSNHFFSVMRKTKMVETAAINELGKALNCSIVTNNHQIVETLIQKGGLPLSIVNGGSNSVHIAIRHG